MNTDLDISSDNLNIDYNLIVFSTSQSVSIFLVGEKRVCKDTVCTQLNFIIFRLCMKNELCFFRCGYFHQKNASQAWLFWDGGDFVGKLCAPSFGASLFLWKFIKASGCVLAFAQSSAVVWESSVSTDFQVCLLTVVEIIEVLPTCRLQSGRGVNLQFSVPIVIGIEFNVKLAALSGLHKQTKEYILIIFHRIFRHFLFDIFHYDSGLNRIKLEVSCIITCRASRVRLGIHIGLYLTVSHCMMSVEGDLLFIKEVF